MTNVPEPDLRLSSRPKPPAKTRLETWKEIAGFFGRTERTVKRWEKERGLPVHRLPGAARSRVFAEVIELENWLKRADVSDESDGEAADPTPPFPAAPQIEAKPAPARKALPLIWRGLALMVALLAVTVMAGALKAHYGQARQPPGPKAEAAYLSGLSALDDHGHESVGQAIAAFTQAVNAAPDFSEAHVGLANAWLKWPDYGQTPDRPAMQAYAEAERAARAGLRADPRSGPAEAVLALSRYYGEWDASGARRGFKQALKRDPENVLTRYPYAHYLLLRGRFDEAQAEINRALELNPSSSAIKADRAMILARLDQPREATELLSDLTRDEPGNVTAFSYLGDIYYAAGNDDVAFEAWDRAFALTDRNGDRQALHAARKQTDRQARLRTWLAQYLSLQTNETDYSYSIAACYAGLGQPSEAVNYLKKAAQKRDAQLLRLGLDPRFAPILANPEFRAFRSRFFEGA